MHCPMLLLKEMEHTLHVLVITALLKIAALKNLCGNHDRSGFSMELLVISLFCFALLLCVLLNFSILYALVGGLCIFLLYGVRKGFTWRQMIRMSFAGVKTAKNVLLTFFLIGILTALWRAAGTIPTIVCYASSLFQPSLFLLMSFLLNCVVSVLTGTAFGTAATMGVICATMAVTMSIPLVLVGGTVLSGVYFGDRCSPVSTSALLVAELTDTNIFENIRKMLKTALLPFLASCFVYLLIGFFTPHGGAVMDLVPLFGREFQLHWIALLPAVLILGLSVFRVSVKLSMSLSILTAIPICLLLQRISIRNCVVFAIFGYSAQDTEVAAMLNGGGIISMLRVAAIVCLSSAYSGIFHQTGLLDGIRCKILALGKRFTPYAAMLCTSALTGLVACNQTLTILLTHQLCREDESDPQTLAIQLENTAVVVAPLIPWSIAGAVPLASVGAPTVSILLAVFLYLLPIYRLFLSFLEKRRQPQTS